MERALVVVREQRERLRLENRYFVVFPGKLANVIERVESREDDECSLVALESAEDIRTAEPGNASHRREQFAQEELLVRVSVLCWRPASPQPSDHNGVLPCLALRSFALLTDPMGRAGIEPATLGLKWMSAS
jgi:hypothetical protein